MHVLGFDAANTDWIGIAAVITAMATLVTALRTGARVKTSNGKTLGQIADHVMATTDNTNQTVGGTAETPPPT